MGTATFVNRPAPRRSLIRPNRSGEHSRQRPPQHQARARLARRPEQALQDSAPSKRTRGSQSTARAGSKGLRRPLGSAGTGVERTVGAAA